MAKRLLLFSAFCLMGFTLAAQISIVSADMPKANDTFTYVTANPTSLLNLVSQNGANQWWNVAESPVKVTQLEEYKSSLKTPYAFYFFNTVGKKVADSIGLGQFKIEDMYQFYSNSSSSYRIEGIGFKISLAPLPLAGNYGVEDKVYVFPLDYGDYDSTPFRVKVAIPLVGAYIQSGYRVTEVVGHGKIVVVNDTFDCLKVKSTIIGADTIETQLTKFGFPTHRVEYKWLTKEHRSPVAEVSGTVIAGQFVPNTARYLNLPPKSPGVGVGTTELPYSDEVNLFFPNPAVHSIHLTPGIVEVEAYTIEGKQMEGHLEDADYSFNWPQGVYLLRFKDEKGNFRTKRLIVAQ
ncbi:MAG: T9SS type A sorting domain-containing protein [Bacteroidota bacterium]|nr:T9SS type A sorting domain-containing protein [Bacteroidota bacterium]MDX5429858.1 T9SS type A sorting domain-containing protein [Bacteroidota bacterium]MDX5468637.1 T9SS type A sorting domain-containing protein [Bacteroidota bacterium]